MATESNGISEYSKYAGLMACITAYYLDSKVQYDPLKIFLASKIDVLPYQIYDYNYLMTELKTSGNIRTLIAYETGLGKTILTGMIIKELLSLDPQYTRGASCRVLVLTPPGVLGQFNDELKTKFDIELQEFDTKNPVFSDLMIASIDSMKLGPWKEQLEDQKWDLVVVDEFHRVSQHNLRGELIAQLTGAAQNFLALTATPHDGRTDRYEYRLKLIAPDPQVVRRTKKETKDISNRFLFTQTIHEHTEEFPISDREKQFYEQAEKYAKDRFKGSGAGALVAIVIGRAISSSIRAGVGLLRRRRERLLAVSPFETSDNIMDDIIEKLQEGVELSDTELATILNIQPDSEQEKNEELLILEPALHLGEELLAQNKLDSKGEYLLQLIKPLIENRIKCLIYTGFLDTVDYLREILENEGYHPHEITGRVSLDERKRTVEQFGKDNRIEMLIGTDAMSESLNLQAASVEINYEVPWSPVTYIQRVGRIWRFGQKHDNLFIHNFLPAFEVEKRVMKVMLQKIKAINQDFGEVGLSVFSKELGSVDSIVKSAYSGEDVVSNIESAFIKSKEVGKKVMEVLQTSMTLPSIINVEELQKSAKINLEGVFSDGDLKRFLQLLRDAGVASGRLPRTEHDQSTFHIHEPNEFVRVETLSLQDRGVVAAIKEGKNLAARGCSTSFSYHKKMIGQVVLFEIQVDGVTVNEEPIVVTEDGLLTYTGLLSLTPSFVGTSSCVEFISNEAYRIKVEQEWIQRAHDIWYKTKKQKEEMIVQTNDTYKKAGLREDLKVWLSKEPKTVVVRKKQDICSVEFLKTETEEVRHRRYEVEDMAMRAAISFYEERGYNVTDVAMQNVGFDIQCESQTEFLRVEVKGIEGSPQPSLTQNERRMAELYPDSFFLFILEIKGENTKKYVVPDPLNNLNWTPHQKIVYSVTGFREFLEE